jgi:hypothetical protein
MRTTRLATVIAVAAVLGACTTLSDSDRALLASAARNAEEAKVQSSQAAEAARQELEASRAAQANAAAAAQSAERAAADARAANEKADRMFQRSLRK